MGIFFRNASMNSVELLQKIIMRMIRVNGLRLYLRMMKATNRGAINCDLSFEHVENINKHLMRSAKSSIARHGGIRPKDNLSKWFIYFVFGDDT